LVLVSTHVHGIAPRGIRYTRDIPPRVTKNVRRCNACPARARVDGRRTRSEREIGVQHRIHVEVARAGVAAGDNAVGDGWHR